MNSSDDDSDPFREIATNAIPELEAVRLYASTEQHIQEEHREFGPSLNQAPIEMVDDTITNPTAVYKSTSHPEGNYLYESTNNTYEGNQCIVPVKVVRGTTSGRVKTAMFTDRVTGTLVWKSANDNAQ